MGNIISNLQNILNRKKQIPNLEEPLSNDEQKSETTKENDRINKAQVKYEYAVKDRMESGSSEKTVENDDEEEYEIVEREILPAKIICPDCGGITLEGLDFCDKCGGELY